MVSIILFILCRQFSHCQSCPCRVILSSIGSGHQTSLVYGCFHYTSCTSSDLNSFTIKLNNVTWHPRFLMFLSYYHPQSHWSDSVLGSVVLCFPLIRWPFLLSSWSSILVPTTQNLVFLIHFLNKITVYCFHCKSF